MTEPGLSAFQVELAAVFLSLPQSRGFLLAGGGALIPQGLVARLTEDLDFFTSRQSGDVDAASAALTEAATSRGWSVQVVRHGPEFRRLAITGSATVRLTRATVMGPMSVQRCDLRRCLVWESVRVTKKSG